MTTPGMLILAQERRASSNYRCQPAPRSSRPSNVRSVLCRQHSTSVLTISFPQCFGPKENEPLDPNASDAAFRALREQIIKETGNDITLDDMVRSRH